MLTSLSFFLSAVESKIRFFKRFSLLTAEEGIFRAGQVG